MKSILTLAFAILAVASAPAQGMISPKTAPMKILQSGPFSNSREQRLISITSQGQFDRYWVRELGQPPQSAPNNLDFVTKKVLAIHLGQRPTGGFRLVIQGIDAGRMNSAIIRGTEFTPLPGTFVSQAITSPWVLIEVDRQLPNPKLSIIRREGNGAWNPIITAPPRGGGNRCTCGPECGCNCGCNR